MPGRRHRPHLLDRAGPVRVVSRVEQRGQISTGSGSDIEHLCPGREPMAASGEDQNDVAAEPTDARPRARPSC